MKVKRLFINGRFEKVLQYSSDEVKIVILDGGPLDGMECMTTMRNGNPAPSMTAVKDGCDHFYALGTDGVYHYVHDRKAYNSWWDDKSAGGFYQMGEHCVVGSGEGVVLQVVAL